VRSRRRLWLNHFAKFLPLVLLAVPLFWPRNPSRRAMVLLTWMANDFLPRIL